MHLVSRLRLIRSVGFLQLPVMLPVDTPEEERGNIVKWYVIWSRLLRKKLVII